MGIRILKVETGEWVNATIEHASGRALPSLHDEGWRFNFARLSRRLENASTYVLVTEDTPHIIEGCLIFQLIDGVLPYGAYLELAPHNRGDNRRFGRVAGCLIAYAFQLSLVKGVWPNNGQLYFEVLEESEEDERKLKENYIVRYGAEEIDGATMMIAEESGHALIKKYLGQERHDASS